MIWLDEIGEADRLHVGGKAFVLARLRQAGLPVPDGFVVAADEVIGEGGETALLSAAARLGGRVAVRSSALVEDTAEASFAGQYRTLLDVSAEALVPAVEAVRRSAEAAAGYARVMGLAVDGSLTVPAVLVQRFVEPRAAGVVFTRHPAEPDAMLVESHPGRGEAVVSGSVRPDRYVLDRETGALREGPATGSLPAPDLATVFRLARRVEDLLGGPQDVEWAVSSGGVVLLQSRPITARGEAPRDPRLRRLTRANVGEVLPDPVTPLTASTVVALLEQAFRDVASRAGLLPADAPPFLVLHRERVYLNLSLCLEIGRGLPGLASDDVERLVLGGGAAQRVRLPVSAWPRLARVLARLRVMARGLPEEIASAQQALARRPSRAAVAAARADELAAMLEGLERTGLLVATAHVATSGACGVRLALLARLLALLAPGEAAPRVNRLVTGLAGLDSAAPVAALEVLAGEAPAHLEWVAWLAQPTARATAALRRGDAPPALRARLADLLRRWGHRGLSEGELRSPTWEDDPSPLLAALQARLSSARPPGFRARAAGQLGRADEAAIASRLGPLRAALFRRGLASAREWVTRREATKSLAVVLVQHGRDIARAAASRLAATGALAAEDDVFFLTAGELGAALRGAAVSRPAVARRRRRWQREAALAAPREVDFSAPGAAPPAEGDLAGLGVSAGIGVGPARVVRQGETARIEPGEVLVAPVLDAALGPLLASAAGAVAEMGGLLSHGAVVARELGVPCVVDVRDATRRIRGGQRILVDGGAGRIVPWPAEAGASARGALAWPPAPGEDFPALDDHPLARESVYFNLFDPTSRLGIVCSLGLKAAGRGEAVLALLLPDGKLLFALERGDGRRDEGALAVAGLAGGWRPPRLRAATRLAEHEADAFPPGPLPVLLAPRTVEATIDLAFRPTTPAVDLCAIVDEDTRRFLEPLGAHHVEQSGTAEGEVVVDGRRFTFVGTGSRDHSAGRRDWDAADHWGLFTVRLGEDVALHALAVCLRGRMVEGGFLWRGGALERVTRVEHAWVEDAGRPRSVELEVTTDAGPALHVRGTVVSTLSVPVQPESRPGRHLAGRPWRLVLDESFTRYEGAGRSGFGIAERARR